MTFAEVVSMRVRNYREKHKISRRALAEKIGISEHALFDIEKCNREIKASTIDKITAATGMKFLQEDEDDYKFVNLKPRPGVPIWRRKDIDI